MFKRSEYSTEVGKGSFIFTLISFIVTTIVAILIITNYHNNALAIFSFIMLIIVSLASIIILFVMISDYSYIEDNILYMSYLFKKSSIDIKDIGKIKLKDSVYYVYNKKGDEIGTINASALGINTITNELYRNNVEFV